MVSLPSTSAPIVSASWLAENLDAPQVVIADCRFSLADSNCGYQEYQQGHIPNAHYFHLNHDLSSPVGRHGGRHPLPNIDRLVKKLESAGVRSGDDAHSTVVIAYDDSRFAFAARLWWLLRYLGHTQVAVLDGGFRHWQSTGYPVTQESPSPQSGHLDLHIQSDRIVDIHHVKDRKDTERVVLIDSREAARYRGEREPIDPIAGHIPGAVNYPWHEVTDDRGLMRSPHEQQQRWTPLRQADEIIVYCGSGVTACVNLLSLTCAGIEHAKLYAGSWSDWCSYCVPDDRHQPEAFEGS
ncbi:MAG: sulfurtransferase [Elainellaceae cyanobacterium]